MLAIAGSAFAQKATVNANIIGLEDGEVVFQYSVAGEHKADTVQTKDGQFTWVVDMPEPQKVYIMFPMRYAEVYAEEGAITITGEADSLHKLQISGSAIQDEADAYRESQKDLTDQEMPLYRQYGKVSQEEQRKLEEKLEEIRIEKRARTKQYILANPKSFFSLELVKDRAMMGAYEGVKPLYDLLDANLQNGMQGTALAERLAVLKRSAIGETVLDFTQNDTEGNPIHFADFKGKYVLIDFWASWCGPCRAENPNVLKEYNKYKDKNFTVLGISLDDNAERWEKAIEEDGMPWTQVSDLQGFKNKVSSYYGIQGIPSTLLVDPEGKIIAKDLRGELLAKKLEEIFM